MESDAYTLGNLDAVLGYGITKDASVLLPAAVAALAARGLAAPGEEDRATILGAAAPFAIQAMMARKGVAPAVAPRPLTFSEVGGHALDQGVHDIKKFLMSPPRPKTAEQFKIALDVGTSFGIPGTGMGVSMRDQRERLPGMARWVPRSTVERGFDYADAGVSPDDAAGQEAERGSLLSPLLGAALAAAGAHKFAPKSGVGGAVLAGLGGAGLGSLYHNATRDSRAREGYEATSGAMDQRTQFPIQRHKTQTANEASPLAVSRGNGDA